jgi:hypothetical protein
LALQSEAFNTTWGPVIGGTGSSPSITANAVISPDGTQNAETVLLNRGAGNTLTDLSALQQTIILATSGTYTFSVYAKATASGDVGKQIFLRAGGAGSLIAYTLTANWVRLTRTETAVASGSNTFQIGNRGTVTADNSVSVDLWGAQVETGSIATSYIPTTAAAVTRNADVVTLSGAVSGCIGQTEGTIYAEVDIQFNNRNADIIGLDSGSSANGFYLTIRSSSVIELRIRRNSTNELIFQRTGAYPVGINKIAVSYKNGDFAISLNGTTTQVDTSTITMPSVAITRASVVPSVNFTLDQSVRVRSAALYSTRLTDSELAALTQL